MKLLPSALLDELAVRFQTSMKWSQKALLREIVFLLDPVQTTEVVETGRYLEWNSVSQFSEYDNVLLEANLGLLEASTIHQQCTQVVTTLDRVAMTVATNSPTNAQSLIVIPPCPFQVSHLLV